METTYDQSNCCTNEDNKNKLINYEYENNFEVLITKVDEFTPNEVCENIIAEYPLCLILNDRYCNTFLCTPDNLKELIVGFLFTKGYISNLNHIKSFNISIEEGIANVQINNDLSNKEDMRFYLNSNDFVNVSPIEDTDVKIYAKDIYSVMDKNLTSSSLFKNTGGVHSVAIYDNKNIVTICEDVARHNAMDKSIGYCLLNNINLKDKIIFVSGRISFEMILKAAKTQIPIVISKSAPTNLSIELSKKLNITLAGFVRGKRMNIYTNSKRIIF